MTEQSRPCPAENPVLPELLVCPRGCGYRTRARWQYQVHTMSGACKGHPVIPKADR